MEFEEAFKIIDTCEGWTTRDELEILFNTAKCIDSLEVIVEIGSYKGRSASALVLGSASVPVVPVFCIDLFDSFKNPRGDVFPGGYREIFDANIAKTGSEDLVVAIKSKAEDVVKTWKKTIGLLFIDGDHLYEECKKDFEQWVPFVSKGGYVFIHDTGMYEGPRKVVREKLAGKKIHVMKNMTWFIKDW